MGAATVRRRTADRRKLIGQRIAKVTETMIEDNEGRTALNVDCIELSNGVRLAFFVVELDGDYGVELVVVE